MGCGWNMLEPNWKEGLIDYNDVPMVIHNLWFQHYGILWLSTSYGLASIQWLQNCDPQSCDDRHRLWYIFPRILWAMLCQAGRSLRIIMGKAAACCEMHGLWRLALGLLKETPGVEEFACGFRCFVNLYALYLPNFVLMLNLELFKMDKKRQTRILSGIPSRRWLTSSWRSTKSLPAPCFPYPGHHQSCMLKMEAGWSWSICLWCIGDFLLPHLPRF